MDLEHWLQWCCSQINGERLRTAMRAQHRRLVSAEGTCQTCSGTQWRLCLHSRTFSHVEWTWSDVIPIIILPTWPQPELAFIREGWWKSDETMQMLQIIAARTLMQPESQWPALLCILIQIPVWNCHEFEEMDTVHHQDLFNYHLELFPQHTMVTITSFLFILT